MKSYFFTSRPEAIQQFLLTFFFSLGTSDAKTELQQLIVGTESVVKENGKRLKLDHCQAGQGVKPLEAGLQRSQSASQISRGNDDLFCTSFGFSMCY